MTGQYEHEKVSVVNIYNIFKTYSSVKRWYKLSKTQKGDFHSHWKNPKI
jgi:hypothetical protein